MSVFTMTEVPAFIGTHAPVNTNKFWIDISAGPENAVLKFNYYGTWYTLNSTGVVASGWIFDSDVAIAYDSNLEVGYDGT